MSKDEAVKKMVAFVEKTEKDNRDDKYVADATKNCKRNIVNTILDELERVISNEDK